MVLEAKLEERDSTIKLLTDSQHKAGFWTRALSWFGAVRKQKYRRARRCRRGYSRFPLGCRKCDRSVSGRLAMQHLLGKRFKHIDCGLLDEAIAAVVELVQNGATPLARCAPIMRATIRKLRLR